MMRFHTNGGMGSLYKRKISNFSSHLDALSGTTFPKKTGKGNVVTSSWIMEPEAAFLDICLQPHTSIETFNGKLLFSHTISSSWKTNSQKDQTLTNLTKPSNGLNQTRCQMTMKMKTYQ